MSDAASHLARNLAGLRHARALTQEALARSAKVPRSTVASLESGAGNPSLVVLVKVAQALGVPIDELLASPRGLVRRWPASEVATRSKGRGVTLRDLVPEPVPDEMMEVLDFAPGRCGVPAMTAPGAKSSTSIISSGTGSGTRSLIVTPRPLLRVATSSAGQRRTRPRGEASSSSIGTPSACATRAP